MKNSHIDTLGTLMQEAIFEAAEQKRRVRTRLYGLRGDWETSPIRGPWKPGRPGVKWHLYQAAKRKHHQLTKRVRALAWAIQNLHS